MQHEKRGLDHSRGAAPFPANFPVKLPKIDLLAEAARLFGVSSFRPGQEQAIRADLNGENIFVNFPTGYGKSLCYQLPTFLDTRGLTIVISPLIALIRDQVRSLNDKGLSVASIDSLQERQEIDRNLALVSSGSVKLLYLSPERLRSEVLCDTLRAASIRRLVVDEAHCYSMWGHDFRPAYLAIPRARERLGAPPTSLFTATAPIAVKEEVLRELQLVNACQIAIDPDRPNLHFSVMHFASTAQKLDFLTEQLQSRIPHGRPLLVYTVRVKTVEMISEHLTSRNVPHLKYHGQLDREDRITIQTKFRQGLAPVIVATKAFGMGVDCPNVGAVINFETPESLDEYVQEAGRAGRDGSPADCVLMYQPHDIYLLRSFVSGANPSAEFIRQVFDMLWRYLTPEERMKEFPVRKFFEPHFLDLYSESSLLTRTKVRSALAALEEHGLICRDGTAMIFLRKPQEFEAENFPITDEMRTKKYQRDQQRLKVMLHYATAGEEPREVILDHFRHNTVVEKVAATSPEALVKLDPKNVLPVCLGLRDEDREISYFASFLSGSRPGSGAGYGALAPLTAREAGIEIDFVASLGHIRLVPVMKRTYLTLTPEGIDLLESHGHAIPKSTTYEQLIGRWFRFEERIAVKSALRQWYDFAKPDARSARHQEAIANQWWRAIEEFLVTDFNILGKNVLGLKLVADFLHIPQKEVLKRHAVTFLNAFFNNEVPLSDAFKPTALARYQASSRRGFKPKKRRPQ